jgi:5,10-methylenetetrahydrofolate reductase
MEYESREWSKKQKRSNNKKEIIEGIVGLKSLSTLLFFTVMDWRGSSIE